MTAFDVKSLRQLADMPLPSDPVELARAWRHVGLDLVAAADEIERLSAEVVAANFDGHWDRAEAAEARVAKLEAALRTLVETLDRCIELAEKVECGTNTPNDDLTLIAHLRVLRGDLTMTKQEQ